jgi:hypothetical protein
MTTKKTKSKAKQVQSAPSYVVTNCTFNATSGKPIDAGSLIVVSKLADALICNSQAIKELAIALQGTDSAAGLAIGSIP